MEELQEIYDRLPTIECQGKCYQSCGPIGMTAAEVDNIQAHGHQVPTTQPHIIHGALTCTALKRKRCQIYDARPLICRCCRRAGMSVWLQTQSPDLTQRSI